MASPVKQRERLESEFEVLATRDPEVFFEAMLISLRSNTMERLDNKRMKVQKIIFKRWFTQYEKRLISDIETSSVFISQVRQEAHREGRAAAYLNLPMKRTLFGHRLDTKAIAERIQELKSDA